jgi:hypothetical protein
LGDDKVRVISLELKNTIFLGAPSPYMSLEFREEHLQLLFIES